MGKPRAPVETICWPFKTQSQLGLCSKLTGPRSPESNPPWLSAQIEDTRPCKAPPELLYVLEEDVSRSRKKVAFLDLGKTTGQLVL